MAESPGEPVRREFTLTRVFDAPREVVFAAWTDPAQFTCWFGPRGTTTPLDTIELDVRPGGRWRACMIREADGAEYPTGGVYHEVVEPERLVFTWGVAGEDGMGEGSLVVVTLAERDGKTELTLHQSGFGTDEERVDVNDGWSSCLLRLAGYLEES